MTSPHTPTPTGEAPRVLIVAPNASARFGGESILPLHYFRLLRRRGVEAWLVVHDRTRHELAELLPDDLGRIAFVPDTRLDKVACRLGQRLPTFLADATFGFASRLGTQILARRIVRALVAEHRVDVVHQPIPVSPREPSLMHGLGAPVIMGPMNGGMAYPPAYHHLEPRYAGALLRAGRASSALLNRLMPGKLRASALLVANERTRRALPKGVRGAVVTLVENGVDLALWKPAARHGAGDNGQGPARFLFMGRLVDWKMVDLLLRAFAAVLGRTEATLDILGDGKKRAALEQLAASLGLGDAVRFLGWQPQAECARRLAEADAPVLPSVFECGGAVVLEAMAAGVPVIATDWGGPADYLDASCGLLVAPHEPAAFQADLADAMTRLAADPALRRTLGDAGRERVAGEYDWERKIDRILEIYGDVARRPDPEAGGRRDAAPLGYAASGPAGR